MRQEPAMRQRSIPTRLSWAGLFAPLFLMALADSTHAANRTWDGGGANDLATTAANWVGDVAPTGSNVDAIFFAGSTRLTPDWNFTSANPMQSVTFNSGAGAFSVNVSGQFHVVGNITNNSSNDQAFTGNAVVLRFAGSPTISAASGNISFANLSYNSTPDTVTFAGAHTITISSATILNFGANGKQLVKTGTGTLFFNGGSSGTVDTSTTGLNINEGTVVAGDNNALGFTTNVRLGNTSGSASASLLLGSGISSNRSILVRSGSSGTATLGSSSDSTTTFSGLVTAEKSVTVAQQLATTGSNGLTLTGGITSGLAGSQTVTFDGPGRVAVNSVIGGGSGTLAVSKTGAGLLILGGNNTYAGTTDISAGTLRLNGHHTGGDLYTVGASGTLQGTGSTASALSVAGVLSPGASIETFGSGTLDLLDGSTFQYEVDSSVATSIGADLQIVNGDLNLANGVGDEVTLTLTDLNNSPTAFALGTTFSLINYDGDWNGGLFTFGGNAISNNETFAAGLNTWQLQYDANSGGDNFSGQYLPASSFVNIVAVPEPTVLALSAVGLILTAGLGVRRCRRVAGVGSKKMD
jgi:autotransporter-associated beta strand protein